LEFSPEEYGRIETRLKELGRVRRKYGCDDAGLLDKLEECRARLDDIEYSDDRLARLAIERDKQKKETRAFADKLTMLRREASARLQKRVTEELRDLNMPFVRFEVEFLAVGGEDGFGPSGQDEIRFLMSANAGEEPGRISKIASGGELSRIMLAMKNVFAEKDSVPTLIFDEIDAGVSGIAAQRVGEKLGSLSKHKQVICVTHLPQIAAMADAHFLIEKSEKSGRTFTSVAKLDREGQKREIARLHGGDNITPTTLLSAEEQLSAADKYKTERM
jgi:DNA repair protein RecN (Recombination protein N)